MYSSCSRQSLRAEAKPRLHEILKHTSQRVCSPMHVGSVLGLFIIHTSVHGLQVCIKPTEVPTLSTAHAFRAGQPSLILGVECRMVRFSSGAIQFPEIGDGNMLRFDDMAVMTWQGTPPQWDDCGSVPEAQHKVATRSISQSVTLNFICTHLMTNHFKCVAACLPT